MTLVVVALDAPAATVDGGGLLFERLLGVRGFSLLLLGVVTETPVALPFPLPLGIDVAIAVEFDDVPLAVANPCCPCICAGIKRELSDVLILSSRKDTRSKI